MRFAAIVLLLCLQEDRWLEGLKSDDVAVRDEAERRLLETGPKALAKLDELARSTDSELRLRASRVAGAIRLAEKRKAVFGPVVAVSIEAKDEPVRGVFARLAKASGFDPRVEDAVEDRIVTLSLKNVPWVEAVLAICRAHGAMRPHEGRLVAGPALRGPVCVRGQVAVVLTSVFLRRQLEMRMETTLGYLVIWQPDVKPIGGGYLLLDELRDSDGGVLEKVALSDQPIAPRVGLYPAGELRTLDKLPAAGSASLKARAILHFAASRPVLAIDAPAEKTGKSWKLGEFDVTLNSVAQEGGRLVVKLTAKCGDACTWRDEHGGPGSLIELRFLDGGGKELPSLGLGYSQDKGVTRYDRYLQPAKDRPLARIEVVSWTDLFTLQVPLEFKEIPLPRW